MSKVPVTEEHKRIFEAWLVVETVVQLIEWDDDRECGTKLHDLFALAGKDYALAGKDYVAMSELELSLTEPLKALGEHIKKTLPADVFNQLHLQDALA